MRQHLQIASRIHLQDLTRHLHNSIRNTIQHGLADPELDLGDEAYQHARGTHHCRFERQTSSPQHNEWALQRKICLSPTYVPLPLPVANWENYQHRL
jgi:hypothetical protein